MAKVKVQFEKSLTSRSRPLDQLFWYGMKVLMTKTAHVKYECPTYTGSEVMAKFKVFVQANHNANINANGKAYTVTAVGGFNNSSQDVCPGEVKHQCSAESM